MMEWLYFSRAVENACPHPDRCIQRKAMPHTIHYNPAARMIQIKVKGTVKPDEFKEIFCEGVELAKKKDCFLFLNDFREASLEMSTMDLYALPKILSDIATSSGLQADRLRRAIVVAPQDARDAGFAEDVTVNRGQHAKVFLDIDEAMEWLAGDPADVSPRRKYVKA